MNCRGWRRGGGDAGAGQGSGRLSGGSVGEGCQARGGDCEGRGQSGLWGGVGLAGWRLWLGREGGFGGSGEPGDFGPGEGECAPVIPQRAVGTVERAVREDEVVRDEGASDRELRICLVPGEIPMRAWNWRRERRGSGRGDNERGDGGSAAGG